MTKKEQKRREAVIKRSNKAIDKLNNRSKINDPANSLACMKIIKEFNERNKAKTDLEKLKAFLEANEMPFEESVNDGVRPYIFVNFHKNGDAIDPC